MSPKTKTILGVTIYLLAAVVATSHFGILAMLLVMLGALGGAMVYMADADDAMDLADEMEAMNADLLDKLNHAAMITLDDVREFIEEEAQQHE